MIGRIDHVGIAVESIVEAAKIYQALGLSVDEIEEVPQEGVRVAMISVGDSRIELLESIAADSPIERFIRKKGPGLHHVCLATDEIACDDVALRRAGFRVLRDQPTRGAGGCWVQFVHPQSASGVLLELSQSDAGPEGGETGAKEVEDE